MWSGWTLPRVFLPAALHHQSTILLCSPLSRVAPLRHPIRGEIAGKVALDYDSAVAVWVVCAGFFPNFSRLSIVIRMMVDCYDPGMKSTFDTRLDVVLPFCLQMEDNKRSIPCLVDGFKPSQRKVLFSCFKRNLKREIKVSTTK